MINLIEIYVLDWVCMLVDESPKAHSREGESDSGDSSLSTLQAE